VQSRIFEVVILRVILILIFLPGFLKVTIRWHALPVFAQNDL